MTRPLVTRTVFYGAVVLLLVLIVTGVVTAALPAGVAGQISHNSEGYAILLVLALWIEFARPRIGHDARGWTVAAAAALSSLALAFFMLLGPLPPSLATLNEAFFALPVLILWTQLPRPVPPVLWLLPVVAVLIPAVGDGSDAVIRAAEVLMAFVFFPVAFDVVDRSLLRPGLPVRKPLVVAWMVFIVVLAVSMHAFRDASPTGFVQGAVDYLSRVNEIFIAVFFIHLYFTILGMAPRARPREPSYAGRAG